jgi:multidrug efflux pump subunit AcrB
LPTINIIQRQSRVISVVLAGDLTERQLRELGEEVRKDIASLPGITQASLGGARKYEIAIEVSEEALKRYGLTFDEVVRAVRTSSLDVPAGSIKTDGGDVLVRTKGQAYKQQDFEQIVVHANFNGTSLTLGDVATVNDGFEETPLYSRFNGKRAVNIDVSRTGNQNAIEISTTVQEYVEKKAEMLPPGVELSFWRDRSIAIRNRLGTLAGSALWGGLLVFLTLVLFLRFSLACWVCLGIPISFFGALAVLPMLGVTINLISCFAFIMVLGIVVDDAIVVGENIFTHLQNSEDPLEAAIRGTREVAVPVTFGILTTIAAFIPLALIPGVRGKIFFMIPAIVIPVLIFSLVESKLILPNHLKHLKAGRREWKDLNPLQKCQMFFSRGLERMVRAVYQPFLEFALRNRYITLSVFVAILIMYIGIFRSGGIPWVGFPRVPSEYATASLSMPIGTPIEVTKKHMDRIEAAAIGMQEELIDPDTGKSIIENRFATTGGRDNSSGQSHEGSVTIELTAPEDRSLDIDTRELTTKWRALIGNIPGAEELSFRAVIMHGGNPIDIQLEGDDFEEMEAVAAKIKDVLAEYPPIYEIADNFQSKKQEIKLQIKPEAELLGLSMADLALQVRQAFFGAEAQRVPRGPDDIRVMVRYPEAQRKSIHDLENMMIRTSAGAEVPFSEVAEVDMGLGFSTIRRLDRRRTLAVLAEFDKELGDLRLIKEDLAPKMDEIIAAHPRMTWQYAGEAQEERDTFASLQRGLLFTLFAIYAMMAIPFRSYVQPIIVMLVIPFGLIGALIGHQIMGMPMSMLSVFGMLALIGVVVNDSLVLVDYVNRKRREGMALLEAVRTAGGARFRAILITSLTTFFGLMPLIFEKSTQAQFLIPMAVSLGFGILFATFVTLVLVPVNYMVLEDIRRGFSWLYGKKK